MSNLNVELGLAREHVATLEQEIANESRRTVEAEHTEAVKQCRVARDEVQRLRGAADTLQRQFIKAQGALLNARRRVADWRVSKPQPSSYPTATAFDEWNAELLARQSTASEAERTYADAYRDYQLARASWATAKTAFERLAERESELRSLLDPKRGSGISIEVRDGDEGMRVYRV